MKSQIANRKSQIFLIIALLFAFGASAQQKILRVCADPNNLPFSNIKGEGFENKIAEMIAREMGAKLEYTWRAQRRGFYRESLKDGDADIAMSAPLSMGRVLTTKPYFTSRYYFVTRKDSGLAISSLGDPQLTKLKIGAQVAMGNLTPPVQALVMRGLASNIVGYSLTTDYSKPNPPAEIIKAVAEKQVDVAIVWGPLAGYFASQQSVPLALTPVPSDPKLAMLPFSFDICIAVRKTNRPLCDQINVILDRHHDEVAKILDEYHIPRVANLSEGEDKKTSASAEEDCPCP